MDLKLGHYSKDGIEVATVEGEIDIYTAPRLRELLIDLASTGNYQLIVDLDKVSFLDSTGLGVLAGALTKGPPRSRQLITKVPPPSPPGSSLQHTSTRPLQSESAPYLPAFVASSCRAMPRACAADAETRRCGPCSSIRLSTRSSKCPS